MVSLDTIQSAVFQQVRKQDLALSRTQARDVLAYVVNRLWFQSGGGIQSSRLVLSQSVLGHRLGLSRQWVNTLLTRLDQAGWIARYAPPVPGGQRGPTVIRIGPQLQRVLIAIKKSRVKSDVKSTRQLLPKKQDNKYFIIQEPTGEQQRKLPLLKTWWERGKQDARLWEDL